MAITVVSDVLVPVQFAGYVQEQSLLKSALVKSGLVSVDAYLSSKLAGGGDTFRVPSWRPITEDTTESNTASFDPTVKSTPEKVTAREQVATRLVRNRSYSTTHMAAMLAGSDPMAAISAHIGERVAADRQASLLAQLRGIVAADSAVLTNDVLTANFSIAGLLGTKGKWGDREPGSVVCVMNSAEKIRRQIANVTAFIPASRSEIGMDTYLNMPVLVDDKLNDGEILLVEAGAVRMGVAQHAKPVAVEADEAAGNGDGAETIYFRDVYNFHVLGTAFKGDVSAGLATDTVLGTAANWDLVGPAKGVGVLKYKFTV